MQFVHNYNINIIWNLIPGKPRSPFSPSNPGIPGYPMSPFSPSCPGIPG